MKLSPRNALAAVATLTLAACGGAHSGGSATTAASGATSVANGGGLPGSVVSAVADAPRPSATVQRIVYRSTSATGAPIEVSGLLFTPTTHGPGPIPIVTWGHGTTGTADDCAPSRLAALAPLTIPWVDDLTAAGVAVVATDYEGLGTPGPHPYLVGPSEGHAVLDAARAAILLLAGGAGATNRPAVVIAGHSQGGQAALWAAELSTSYAPDLDVRGVVAAAPASELSHLLESGPIRDAAGGLPGIAPLLVPAIGGLAAAYPELHPADVLSDVALAALPQADSTCVTSFGRIFGSLGAGALRVDPLSNPAWAARIVANDAGRQPMLPPALVLQGDADTTVPKLLTDRYVHDACGLGAAVNYRSYPGVGHGEIVSGTPRQDALAWIADRVAGTPVARSCADR